MDGRFLGGDRDYIRNLQYGTTAKLEVRAKLHQRYSTAETPWFAWMVAQIPWAPGPILESGCGTGALWDEGLPPVDDSILLTDLSAGMVEAASARARAAGYAVTGGVADAQLVPVADRRCAHVISNHMLYHVPDTSQAVAEFARVLADDGLLTVATNGARHMASLKELERAVFETSVVDRAVDAFGLVSGATVLEAAFEEVVLRRYTDELRVTSRRDVLAYLTSYPPGEDATLEQRAALEAEVDAVFAVGTGVLIVEKEVGLFLCRGPRRTAMHEPSG